MARRCEMERGSTMRRGRDTRPGLTGGSIGMGEAVPAASSQLLRFSALLPRFMALRLRFAALLLYLASAPLCFALFSGCDRQRDLYVESGPRLIIESDWKPSLGMEDMSGRATAMLYGRTGNPVQKEFFTLPDRVAAMAEGGVYDILIFNGMMTSEEHTGLEQIYYRNTGMAADFEAVAAGGIPNDRLPLTPGEYVAANDMDILASAYTETEIDGRREYYVKYVDGRDCYGKECCGRVIKMTPRPLSYYAKVIVHLINPKSAKSTVGALRGFAGSVFMASGMPSQHRITHHLAFKNMLIDETSVPSMGLIESQLFVTFGPPLDLPEDSTYEFVIDILLKDGRTVQQTFDVTPQVLPIIEKIKKNTLHNSIDKPIVIVVGTTIQLPFIESEVDVGIWEDGDTIRVPV